MIQLVTAMLVFAQGAVLLCHPAFALASYGTEAGVLGAAINSFASQYQILSPLIRPPAASHIDNAAVKAQMSARERFLLLGPEASNHLRRKATCMCFGVLHASRVRSKSWHLYPEKALYCSHSRGIPGTGSALVWTSSIDPQWTPSGSSHLVTLQGIIAYAGYRMWTAISQIMEEVQQLQYCGIYARDA
jgi:hypothetical protein